MKRLRLAHFQAGNDLASPMVTTSFRRGIKPGNNGNNLAAHAYT